MPRTIKLTIEYDGTEFQGWQTQTARARRGRPSTPQRRTVQNEIERALKTIFGKNIKITGSGRTDSGVHALGQVAHFVTDSPMSAQEMINALNANLPADIAILHATDAPDGFHAQYGAKSKTYRYTVFNAKTRCAQQRNFYWHYPYPLNIRKMRAEAKGLIGRKDFRSFAASDPARRKAGKEGSTVRTVKRLDIKKRGDTVVFEIEANGFLYKMVRNIVGTLLDVGTQRLPQGSIKRILAAKDRGKAGNTAKAKGLALIDVRY